MIFPVGPYFSYAYYLKIYIFHTHAALKFIKTLFGQIITESPNLPIILQWVNVPAITNEKCNDGYGGDILDSMICAGFEEGGKDACQGGKAI